MVGARARASLIVFAIVAIAACAGFGYWAWDAWQDAKLKSDADAGLNALYRGDYAAAQRDFTAAVDGARAPEDRAGYQLLLAGSLEANDPQQAADRYLDLIGRPGLSEQTRASASVHLLMFLSARGDASFTRQVFARSPWAGSYQQLQQDESINADIAIAKAHEAIATSHPNFLSYLLAGEFYARKYPYMTGALARFRSEYGQKAAEYFDKGVAMLRAARDGSEWDRTRLALGYMFAATYAVELFDNGLGSLDERALRAFYLEAAGYADAASAGEAILEQVRFSIRLAYARHLAAHAQPEDASITATIAAELAGLATKAPNRPAIAQIMGATDATSRSGRLRPALFFMASSSPALAREISAAVVQYRQI
ncbi:MAG: hypothetical protein KIT25_03840 [Enhydrobacter sp.]|nr:MAG: hypothetical protein KIT25_03840 [Enhydrobacter sp.]